MCLKPSTYLLVVSALLGVVSAVLSGLALASDELAPQRGLVAGALVLVILSTFLILFLVVTRYERLKAVDRPGPNGADSC